MYFYILILCVNTITSMINTDAFFDFTDFQVPLCAVQPTAFVWVREGPLDSNSVNGDRRVRVHVGGPCYLVVVLCGVVFVLGLQRRTTTQYREKTN